MGIGANKSDWEEKKDGRAESWREKCNSQRRREGEIDVGGSKEASVGGKTE